MRSAASTCSRFDPDRAFQSYQCLRQQRRLSRSRLGQVVADIRPLVGLVLRDLNREEGGRLARDAEELTQNVVGWLVGILPRIPATFETARLLRAYLSIGIRRQLVAEISRLRRARTAPRGFSLPEPSRSELSELEDRLYVEDVLATAERRILDELSTKDDATQADGLRFAVRSYLRGEEPSALHLRFALGISEPRSILEKARVRLRMELADIWRRDLAGVRSSGGPVATLFGGKGRQRPARGVVSQDGSAG